MIRFAFALLLLSGVVWAECLQVLVKDPSGLPVQGASVQAGRTSARTDAKGMARVCELAPGSHPVAVDAPAFARAVIAAEAPGEHEVTLALQARTEPPVVVTGTIEPQQVDQMDRSVTVIPVENADVPGTWLTDLLKSDPSVDVRERGVDGTQADVSIRGGSFGQTLVLINGQRVSDPQSGHHNMDLPLPTESVARIEVLRGSGSTLYGSDAVGGAINVITRKPQSAELNIGSGLGDFGWNRQSASGAFRLGRWGQHVGISRDFSTGFRRGRDFRNLAVASESYLDWGFGSTNALIAYNDRPFGADGFYGPYPSLEITGTHLLALSQTVRNHRFQFSYRRHRDHYILYRDQPSGPQNLHTGQTWNASYGFHQDLLPGLEVSGGIDVLRETVDSTNLGNRARGRSAGFLVFQARPLPRMTLTVGLREEFYSRWRAVTSPSVAAGVRLGGGFKLRGSVGHAYRIPTYTDLYYHDPSNIGNPNLKPENAWTYEAGLDWWGNRGTSASATWFERRERDTIDFVRPAGAIIWQSQNFERLNFHGGELAVRQRLRRGEVGFSYTILRASRELLPGFASRYVFNFPLNSAAVTSRLSLGRYVTARTRIGVFNRSWQSTKGLWDVSVSGQLSRFRPYLQVTNLLNSYSEAFPGLAQPGRWIRGGLEIHLLSGR